MSLLKLCLLHCNDALMGWCTLSPFYGLCLNIVCLKQNMNNLVQFSFLCIVVITKNYNKCSLFCWFYIWSSSCRAHNFRASGNWSIKELMYMAAAVMSCLKQWGIHVLLFLYFFSFFSLCPVNTYIRWCINFTVDKKIAQLFRSYLVEEWFFEKCFFPMAKFIFNLI